MDRFTSRYESLLEQHAGSRRSQAKCEDVRWAAVRPFKQGRKARQQGLVLSDNPYVSPALFRLSWAAGWSDMDRRLAADALVTEAAENAKELLPCWNP